MNSGSKSTQSYHGQKGQGKVGRGLGIHGERSGSGWASLALDPAPGALGLGDGPAPEAGRRPVLYRIWLTTKGRKPGPGLRKWSGSSRGTRAQLGKGYTSSPTRSQGSGKGGEVSDPRPRTDGSVGGGVLLTRSQPSNTPE